MDKLNDNEIFKCLFDVTLDEDLIELEGDNTYEFDPKELIEKKFQNKWGLTKSKGKTYLTMILNENDLIVNAHVVIRRNDGQNLVQLNNESALSYLRDFFERGLNLDEVEE
ncbi:hypothetical protein [Halobacteriovorax sp.]|uniref:hypothetical protein n=1 Tax=Halobacteriovorax sp. TaxID=2020862 RepID=UPI003AF2689A